MAIVLTYDDTFESNVHSILEKQSVLDILLQERNIEQISKKVVTKLQKLQKTSNDNFEKQIPGLVSKYIQETINNYLCNNTLINNILTQHAMVIDQNVAARINATVEVICSQEGHQQLALAHIKALEEKFNTQSQIHDQQFKIQTQEMWSKYNQLESELITKIKKLDELEKKSESLETGLKHYSVFTFGLCGLFVGLVVYLGTR